MKLAGTTFPVLSKAVVSSASTAAEPSLSSNGVLSFSPLKNLFQIQLVNQTNKRVRSIYAAGDANAMRTAATAVIHGEPSTQEGPSERVTCSSTTCSISSRLPTRLDFTYAKFPDSHSQAKCCSCTHPWFVPSCNDEKSKMRTYSKFAVEILGKGGGRRNLLKAHDILI